MTNEDIEQQILDRLHNGPATFSDLRDALGLALHQERTLDKALQRLRRHERISFSKSAREWLLS